MRAFPGSTFLLCAIAAMFAVELSKGALGNDSVLLALGALPDTGQLHGEYWRLVTFGFLHANFTHVLLNAMLLCLVAPVTELRVGVVWLIVLFLGASIASGACILIKHVIWPSLGTSVGASGGLFGLLGAAVILVSRRPSTTPRIRFALLGGAVLGFAYSVVPGVSMVGHISGFVVGATAANFIPMVARKAPQPTV
jgi:membrane associated rhomboid family serine protease